MNFQLTSASSVMYFYIYFSEYLDTNIPPLAVLVIVTVFSFIILLVIVCVVTWRTVGTDKNEVAPMHQKLTVVETKASKLHESA